MTTTRITLLEEIASEIEALATSGIIRVGVDGVDGAGKTWFAAELAEHIDSVPVIRASIDSFHNPRAVRYAKGKDSPEGFFEDSFNYPLFKEYLLDPLSSDGSMIYRTEAFDYRTDQPVASPSRKAETPSILIVDGIFLHCPELADYWDYSIFLRVSPGESVRRCMIREGISDPAPDPDHPRYRRYVRGQEIYMSRCEPVSKATRVIDNEELEEPFIIG